MLAVGDTHLENFGTWTDREGRIVWGVNDYDETAEMPYILDLLRLATSAALATTPGHLSLKAICNNLFDGYEQGIDAPEAFVLDHKHMWLRQTFRRQRSDARAVLAGRSKTNTMTCLPKRSPQQPPARWLKVFADALPEASMTMSYWRHTAGTGSLGRPRWLGFGNWHGGPVLREGQGAGSLRLEPRAPRRRTPCGSTILRPADTVRPIPGTRRAGTSCCGGCRRTTARSTSRTGATPRACCTPTCCGRWGAISPPYTLACATAATRLKKDLQKRKARWFRTNVETATEFVAREWAEFKK